MNMQQIMKQAQAMQKEITSIKKEIDNMEFLSKQQLVEVKMTGDKVVKSITIDKNISSDDIEMLEDLLTVAVNDCLTQIDKITEKKMGKYSNAMNGLF